MRRATLAAVAALACLLLPLVPPIAAANGTTIRVDHLVEVAGDLSETVTITVTYDTTRYSEKWTWQIPKDATALAVRDEMGAVTVKRDAADPGHITFETHYGNCCRRGDRDFTITFERPGLDPVAVPFYRGGQSTVGADNFDTRFRLHLDSSLRLARSEPELAETSTGWETRTVQPRYIRYIVEAPKAAGMQDFTVGPWRFVTPQALARDLREIAQEALSYVNDFEARTGIPSPYARYLVAVEPGSEFSWEIGKAIGDGIILLNGDAFLSALEKGRRLTAREGLVHETFHAATTDALEWTRVLQWWKEGTAVNAEQVLEAGDGPEVAGCAIHETGSTCFVNSTRITYESLAAYYRAGKLFPLRQWSPDAEQTAETRRFGYAYSGFVVSAYIERYGEDAYRAVWRELAAINGSDPSACASCDNDLLEARLLKHAPGATLEDLWWPYRSLFLTDEEAFRERVASLVAPALPLPPGHVVAGEDGLPATGADGEPVVRVARPPAARETIPSGGLLFVAAAAVAAALLARRR